MEQFAKKHYSFSSTFIAFLRFGIKIRSGIAQLIKHSIPIFLIISDLLFINFSLLVGTYIKFNNIFGFPSYAYPIVFIAVTLIYFFLQFINGEYFENRISLPKTALSLMLSFFILSSLTYFLPEFRFSRSALLIMIAMTLVLSFATRIGILLYKRIIGDQADRRIIIAGNENTIEKIIEALQQSGSQNIHLLGVVSTNNTSNINTNLPYLGSLDDISIIALKNKADEVIITDNNIPKKIIMNLMNASNTKIKYHIISEYDQLETARFINDVANTHRTQFSYNIIAPRFKFIKRTIDIILSTLLLTIAFPVLLFFKTRKNIIKNWFNVFIGTKTTIGLYTSEEMLKHSLNDTTDDTTDKVKDGIISLVSITGNANISLDTINKLNDYYINNYSLSLDFDILLRYFTRNK